jgi:hypothetical protein
MFAVGLIGTMACILAIVVALRVGARLCRATDRLFDKLESTVDDVQTRVVHIRERIDEAKITTADIAENLKSWTKREAIERAAVRLDVEKKTEKLASILLETDHWLELSGSACELLQRGFSVAASESASKDPTRLDRLIEDIAILRTNLAEATQTVTRIRDWTAEKNDAKPVQRRIEQVVELAVRLAATVGAFDSSLDKLQDRLSQAKEDVQELKAKTIRRIRLATVAVMFLIVWIGAGQVALSIYGCRRMPNRRALSSA